jgi:hypothetical protein
MECYQQEIFGPVLVCLTVDTLDDAIDLINANKYGNGVAVFTNSGATATRFQRDIEAGQIGINTPIPGRHSLELSRLLGTNPFLPSAPPHVLVLWKQSVDCWTEWTLLLRQIRVELLHAAQDSDGVSSTEPRVMRGQRFTGTETLDQALTGDARRRLWRSEDAIATKASTAMPTHS